MSLSRRAVRSLWPLILVLLIGLMQAEAGCKTSDASFVKNRPPTVKQPSKTDPTKVLVSWGDIITNAKCVDVFTLWVYPKGMTKQQGQKYEIKGNVKPYPTSHVVTVEPCVTYLFELESLEKEMLFSDDKDSAKIAEFNTGAKALLISQDKTKFEVGYVFDRVNNVLDFSKAAIRFPKSLVKNPSCISFVEIEGKEVVRAKSSMYHSGGQFVTKGAKGSQMSTAGFGRSRSGSHVGSSGSQAGMYPAPPGSPGSHGNYPPSHGSTGGSGYYPGANYPGYYPGTGGSGSYPGYPSSSSGGHGSYPGSSTGGSGSYPGSSTGGSGSYPGSSTGGSGGFGGQNSYPSGGYRSTYSGHHSSNSPGSSSSSSSSNSYSYSQTSSSGGSSSSSGGFRSTGFTDEDFSLSSRNRRSPRRSSTSKGSRAAGSSSELFSGISGTTIKGKLAPPYYSDVIEVVADITPCKDYDFKLKIVGTGSSIMAEIKDLKLPSLAELWTYKAPPLHAMLKAQLVNRQNPPNLIVERRYGVPEECINSLFMQVDLRMMRLENDLNSQLVERDRLVADGKRLREQIEERRESQLKFQFGCKCDSMLINLNSTTAKAHKKFAAALGYYRYAGEQNGKPFYIKVNGPLSPSGTSASGRPNNRQAAATTTTTTTPKPAKGKAAKAAVKKEYHLYWDRERKGWAVGFKMDGDDVVIRTKKNNAAKCPADPETAKEWEYSGTFSWHSDAPMKAECSS